MIDWKSDFPTFFGGASYGRPATTCFIWGTACSAPGPHGDYLWCSSSWCERW